MNIIQLYINDGGTGTPFEEGLNTIVIPTSLFTETIFNAHVQNETLSDTPIYSSDEEKFIFISVGRDGNTEQACDEIDFIIIRFDISSEDAMEVLELLLTCLVNETTNETAVVYSYVSTKLNGISAVMMNLPISVIRLVPWFCDFSDSPMGSKPETFEDWFWKPLNSISAVLIGVIITIGMAIAALVMLIVDFIVEIFMDILPILGYILWLIIRVIILILVWIMFVITLIIVVLTFLVLIPIIIVISELTQANSIIKVNSLTIQSDSTFTTFKYTIGLEHNAFFDIEIPTLYFSFILDNSSFVIPYNLFNMFILPSFDTLIPLFSNSSSDPQSSTIHESSFILQPKSSGSSEEDGNDLLSGFSAGFAAVSVLTLIYGVAVGGIPNKFLQKIALLVTVISFVVTWFYILSVKDFGDGFSPAWVAGISLGAIVALLIGATIAAATENISGDPDLADIYGVIGISISLFFIITNIFKLIDLCTDIDLGDPKLGAGNVIMGIILSIASLIIGGIAIGLDGNIGEHFLPFLYIALILFHLTAFLMIWAAVDK